MTIVYRADGTAISNSAMDENFEQLSDRYSGSSQAASAALSLDSQYSYFTISGNTDIIAIDGDTVGRRVSLQFDEVGGSIGHATALLMPGGSTISWRAGDVGVFVYESTGVWRCISYERGDLAPDEAITQANTDDSTLGASTAFADNVLGSYKEWELLEVFTVDGTWHIAENTAVPADAVGLRWLGSAIDVAGNLSLRCELNVGNDASYTNTSAETVYSRLSITTIDQDSVQGTIGYAMSVASINAYADMSVNQTLMKVSGSDTWIGGGNVDAHNGDGGSFGTGVWEVSGGVIDRTAIEVANENLTTGTLELWVLR